MPTFSAKSLAKLATCDQRLQQVAHEAIQDFDFSVIAGHRNREDQDKACAAGFSKTPWPTSNHNCIPSRAMDLAPWPIDWKDVKRFKGLAKCVLAAADKLGIKIRWGGDWDMDGDSADEKFLDMPHFELIED